MLEFFFFFFSKLVVFDMFLIVFVFVEWILGYFIWFVGQKLRFSAFFFFLNGLELGVFACV